MLSFYACAYWPFVSHLWRNVCLDLLPILNWVICVYFWIVSVLYTAYKYLIRYVICKYLLLWVVFVDSVFSTINVFNFEKVQFIFFFTFVVGTFSVIPKNSLPSLKSWRFTPIFFFKWTFWLHCIFVVAWAFFSCGERGPLFVAVHGLLIAVDSLVAECGL